MSLDHASRGGRPRKMTPAMQDRLIEMRERGKSHEVIRRTLEHEGGVKLSLGVIEHYVLLLGAEPPRPQKLKPVPAEPVVRVRGRHFVRLFTVNEDKQLLALEAEGKSTYEIAKRLGRRSNVITARLRLLARREDRNGKSTD